MPANTGELQENKYVLLWPMPIPKEIRELFTMIFTGALGLITYVCRVLTNTDTFHLIIPLNCLGQLIKDQIHQLPQVVHIDVICDNIRELSQVQPWFTVGCEKIQFHVIDQAFELWKIAVREKRILATGSIGEIMKNIIISMIQTRVTAKRSDASTRRFHVVKEFSNPKLYSLPAKNINTFDSNYICPSCRCIYGEACQLTCGHHQCTVCATIQKKCATCDEDILRNKVGRATVKVNENTQMEMQDLPTQCSDCDSMQPFRDYETHLKEIHPGLITRLISDSEDDGNIVTSFNGGCIWEIHDIEQLKSKAMTDGHKSIYSPPFYPFPNGYKMCLRLFINGDEKGRDTHMSLFFVIMRGEYDEKLLWPFEFKTTFSLLDQSTIHDSHDHIDRICWLNSTLECFDRPHYEMNAGFGFPMCVPLHLFKEHPHQYIKNNTMYIKFTIDLFAEKPAEPLMNTIGELPNEEKHVAENDDNNNDIKDLICFDDFTEALVKTK